MNNAYTKILNDSELSASVRETISRAVQAAKVDREERCELAMEMIDHFRSGLAAGTAEADLIAEFGDPKQAGRLMGRAAKRKRNPLRRSLAYARRGVWVTAGVLVLVYAFALLRYHIGAPSVTRDYVAELRTEQERIPQSERAWPYYLRVAQQTTDLQGLLEDVRYNAGGDADESELLQQYIGERPEIAEQIRSGAGLPFVGYPLLVGADPELERIYEARDENYTWEPISNADLQSYDGRPPMMFEILLPYIQEMREQSRLLEADAHNALGAGDAGRFLRNVEALVGMGDQVRRERTLIEQLVGIALGRKADALLRRGLTDRPGLFTADQLAQLRAVIEASPSGRTPIDLSLERTTFADLIQRVYTDNGDGDGRITAEGLRMLESLMSPSYMLYSTGVDSPLVQFVVGPAAGVVVASRKETQEKYDELMDAAERAVAAPLWDPVDEPDVYMEVERLLDEEKFRYPMIGVLMPAMNRVRVNNDQLAQSRNSVILALAIQEHRLRTGAYPASLDEIDVEARFTIDQWTGERFLYTRSAGGDSYTLYTMGTDFDDDGGTLAPGGNSKASQYFGKGAMEGWTPAQQAESDGDWVFMPAPEGDE